MIKFETYLGTLDDKTIVEMYELIFKNHVTNYIEIHRGQIIKEMLDEIKKQIK